jgi:hypothetical protein
VVTNPPCAMCRKKFARSNSGSHKSASSRGSRGATERGDDGDSLGDEDLDSDEYYSKMEAKPVILRPGSMTSMKSKGAATAHDDDDSEGEEKTEDSETEAAVLARVGEFSGKLTDEDLEKLSAVGREAAKAGAKAGAEAAAAEGKPHSFFCIGHAMTCRGHWVLQVPGRVRKKASGSSVIPRYGKPSKTLRGWQLSVVPSSEHNLVPR